MPVTHAGIVFHTGSRKLLTRCIEDITDELDNDDSHIQPQNCNDFDSKKTYYSKRSHCSENCEINHLHYGYFACNIFYLGGK